MKIKKEEFEKMATEKGLTTQKQWVDLAMDIQHDQRPRLDDVRSWQSAGTWRIDGTNRGADRH